MLINIELITIIVLTIWLLVLSFFLWQLSSHYNNLIKGTSTRTLRTLLEELLKETGQTKKDIANVIARCDTIEKEALTHIQRIGLSRFNPFKDTGGNQSFIVCLVDAQDSGIVISGLYSRSGTRWYAKKILNGKGLELELSEEEKKALKEAKIEK